MSLDDQKKPMAYWGGEKGNISLYSNKISISFHEQNSKRIPTRTPSFVDFSFLLLRFFPHAQECEKGVKVVTPPEFNKNKERTKL